MRGSADGYVEKTIWMVLLRNMENGAFTNDVSLPVGITLLKLSYLNKITISDDMIMICHRPAYIILLDDSMTAQHIRLRHYDTICSIDPFGLFTYI